MAKKAGPTASYPARNGKRVSCFRSEFAFCQHWSGRASDQCGGNKRCLRSDSRTSGRDEKDINVSLDENQLVISGEKRAESAQRGKGLACRGAELRLSLTDPCLCLSSRKTEPSTHISTRACCISQSRSLPRRRKSARQSVLSQVLHRARNANKTAAPNKAT